jgi:thiol-disulfide isomerase/thioredoxin
MNLADYYANGTDYETYVAHLGEYRDLHNLHYRKYQVSPAVRAQIKKMPPQRILVITEPWCGDSLAQIPVVRKIAEEADDWEIRILMRDENKELMDYFLTRGSRGIPVFIFLDENDDMLFRFGPRPEPAQQIFETYREAIKAGKIEKPEVMKKIRMFYAKDCGRSIENELSACLAREIRANSATLKD